MGSSIPQVEDLNGDGIKDIVTSDYFSNIHFFEGVDSKNYKAPVNFKKTDGSDLEIVGAAKTGSGINDGGVYGALTMNDWNEDGLVDILFTARHCPLIVFYNEGEDGAPVFGEADTIKIGGQTFIDDRPALTIYDINLDGKKDIVFGRDKIVSYSLNTGSNDSPKFNELSDATLNDGDPIDMKYGAGAVEASPIHGETQVAVADWNNDGYPDLLVGENTGWTIGGPLEYMFLFLGVPDGSVENKTAVIHNENIGEFVKYNAGMKSLSINCSNGELSVITLNGKKVKHVKVDALTKTISLKGVTKGAYILYLTTDKFNMSKRLIIE